MEVADITIIKSRCLKINLKAAKKYADIKYLTYQKPKPSTTTPGFGINPAPGINWKIYNR